MDHLNTSPNWHIAHIFDWSITPRQFSHLSLPVANWHRRKDSAISFFFPKRLLDTRDQMVCLRMSLVASCYVWQCGLIWQLSVFFFSCLQEEATGKIALGLISSLIQRTANISDKDIWWREVHSSRLPSLKAEPFSLRFRQHVRAMYAMCACRQPTGRQAGAHCFSSSTQTQRQMINLCRTTNIPPNKILLRDLFFFQKPHNVYKCNSARRSILVLLNHIHRAFIKSKLLISRPQHCTGRCTVKEEVAMPPRNSTSVTLSSDEPIFKK